MQRSQRNWFMLVFGIILFAGFVIATTVITDRDITFDQGSIISLKEINLTNSSLVISDQVEGSLVAIFNGEFPDIMTRALNPITFGSATSSFFGDVNNFDNVNGFSRFAETNLNDGELAAGGFTAINDIGFNITFGIGSSNFRIGGINLNNTPAIQSNAPAPFRFINRDQRGFNWRANTNNNISSGATVREIMNLTFSGDLNIIGNFTGNLIELIGFEPKHTCNATTTGQIVYEANGSMGDFFGCKQQNINTFIWTKF